MLIDFGATNGVPVNGDFVRATRELAVGDEISVGGTHMVLERI